MLERVENIQVAFSLARKKFGLRNHPRYVPFGAFSAGSEGFEEA